MRWKFLVLMFTILIGTCAIENTQEATNGTVQEKEKYDREGWKVMKELKENDEWIPQNQPQEYRLIRRRLRKRKKRPPIDSPGDGNPFKRPSRRRVRPYLLSENFQSPWEEVREENATPYIRRRIPPRLPILDELTQVISHKPSNEYVNNETKANSEKSSLSEQSNDTYLTKTQDSNSYISNIKLILKQTSGKFSLSEVLQQKNLSLNELLSGNKDAFSSIIQKPLATTEKLGYLKKNAEKESDIKLLKTIEDTTNEHFIPKILAQNMFNNTVRKAVTKPVNITDNILQQPIMEKILNDSAIEQNISVKVKKGENIELNTLCSTICNQLPTTNAKLKNTVKFKKTNIDVNKFFLNPIKINLSEVIGFTEIMKPQTVIKTLGGGEEANKPFRVKIDLGNTSENEKPITEDSTNTIYVTAREEIMEVLKDPKTREKMSKILELRNMTIEELVEQRERGSSQIHLADIFHNNSMEPEPQEEVLIGLIEPSHGERQQKSRQFEEKLASKNITVERTPDANNLYNINTSNILPSNNFSVNVSTLSEENIENMERKTLITDLIDTETKHKTQNLLNPLDLISEIPHVKSMKDTISLSSNENFNTIEIFEEHDNLFKLPSGVKSAIFVSLAIIGLSIVVFLAILLIFKWSQLKHRKVNYCNSLTSKFNKSPIILHGRSTSAIKTFVNETLGKRKNFYKSNVQRMCDDIWEGEKERKLSF